VNLKEGTRRLALLLGAVGAILGGFVSYLELDSVMAERARHNRFEHLANSVVVQQERKTLQAPPDFIPDLPPGAKLVHLPSKVNQGGIKSIHWTDDYGVESIETEDGQTLYPTPVPSAWVYLLAALFPVLGFFIPWGAIRAIGWVGAGFMKSST
jgi:hypothetical protein